MTGSGLTCDKCRGGKKKCDPTRTSSAYKTWNACPACVQIAMKTGENPEDICTNVQAILKAKSDVKKAVKKAEAKGEETMYACLQELLAFPEESRKRESAVPRDPITV